MQGECQPTLAFNTMMVTGGIPLSLAVREPEIFWGTPNNQVAKANIDGSGGMLLGMTNGGAGVGVNGLAVTNLGVYATNGNRVTMFNLSGGSMWQSVNDTGVNNVAANDTYVVWTATGVGRVKRADAVNGNQKDFATSEMGPTSIILEGNVAHWTNSDSGEFREAFGVDFNTLSTMFVGPVGSHLLVHDGNFFYWVANEMVFRGMPGITPEPLFPTGPDVRALVVDDNHIYWTLGSVGEIRRASKTLPYDPKPIVQGQPEPHSMVIGSDSVFWANRGDRTIMRLAR